MINATNISRVFKRRDKTIKQFIMQCKTIINKNNISLKEYRFGMGEKLENPTEKIFNSMDSLANYYMELSMGGLQEVRGIPVKIIGKPDGKWESNNKEFMVISEIFKGLDVMPVKDIYNTLILDYADINYIRAIPLWAILGDKITGESGAYLVSSNGLLSDICRYPIPIFSKILWEESKIG